MAQDESSASSNSDNNKKVTCTTIFQTEDPADKKEGLTGWLSKSGSLKSGGRRQSLDLLIDASDRVKDVFASSFQKVGKSLERERRNSESELAHTESGSASEFFSFRYGNWTVSLL